MSFNQIFSKIFKKSIFELLPELKDVAFSEGSIKVIPPNTLIVPKGSILRDLIIPLDAELKMEKDSQVTFLRAGRSLALQNLLFKTPVDYDFSSIDKTRVFILPFEALEKYLEINQTAKKYLLNITSSPGCRSFKRYLEDKGLKQDSIVHLISLARDIQPNDAIERFGKDIILIESGDVLFNLDDSGYLIVDRLSTGAFFGNSFLKSAYKKPFSINSINGRLKSIPIDLIQPLLTKNYDIDSLVYEPFVKLEIAKLFFDFSDYETTTNIPGESIALENVVDFIETDFPFHQMLNVSNDFESISASVYHALLFFKRNPSLDNIKAGILFNGQKLTAASLGNIFFEHGIESIQVSYTKDSLDEFNSPFVFFVGNKLCFCLGRSSKGFIILDPSAGFKVLQKKDFASLDWSGDITLLRPNLFFEFRSDSSDKISDSHQEDSTFKVKKIMEIIISMVLSDKQFIGKILLCSGLIFGVDILVPRVSQYLLDEVLKTSDNKTLVSLVVLMVVLYLCSVILTYFRTFLVNAWGAKFNDKFTSSIISVIFSKKTFSGKKVRIGDVMQRFGEIDDVRAFFGPETITTVINVFSMFAYIAILFTYSIKIALVPIAFLIIIMLTQFILKKKMRAVYHLLFELGSKKESFLGEVISSMATVKAFNYEKKLSSDWDETLVSTSAQEKKIASLSSLSSSLTSFFNQLLYIVAMWLGVYTLLDGKADFSPGEIFAMSQYLQKVLNPLNSMVGFFTQYEDVKISIGKISDLIPITPQTETNFRQAIRLNGKIKLNNVFFRYSEDGANILRNINLTLYPNQKVAIVGPSGSGKTTLANIIAGIEKPSSGQILFDDVEADSLSESSLKSQIGYIRQQNDLLSGSLEANIAFTDSSPQSEYLDRAAYLSGSMLFIDEFPQRFKTELAEGGTGLSGGQKQRIAIARSIYNDPKILIFDEATSALDSESESFLLGKLDELCKNKTTVIIAHRLSTIRRADTIVCVDNGEIVQVGSHQELIGVQGLYRDLFLEQAGGE